MKVVFPLLLILMVMLPDTSEAQQYFVLQKRGTVKNFKYQTGNKIHLKTLNGGYEISGEITQIQDTSIFINHSIEVGISNIGAIYRKSGFLNRLSGLFFIRGGIAYFLIDGANRTIHQEYPIIPESTLLISGAMVATGFAIRPFITRKFDATDKWQVKILNFDEFK
jgi:hypothetical protein